MVAYLLKVTKTCIVALWKQESPPSISLWLIKIADIHAMENITATIQGKEEKCNNKWTNRSLFTGSRDYGHALVEGG